MTAAEATTTAPTESGRTLALGVSQIFLQENWIAGLTMLMGFALYSVPMALLVGLGALVATASAAAVRLPTNTSGVRPAWSSATAAVATRVDLPVPGPPITSVAPAQPPSTAACSGVSRGVCGSAARAHCNHLGLTAPIRGQGCPQPAPGNWIQPPEPGLSEPVGR